MYNIHIHRYSYISLPFPRTQTRQNHSAYVHIFPILPSNQQSWQRHHPRQLANLALIPLAHCSKIHPKPNHTWVTAKRSWCKTPWWVEQLKLLKLGLFRPAAHRWKGRELLHTPQVGNLTMTGWPVKADKCGPEFRCKLSVLQLIHLIWEFPFNPISIWTGKKKLICYNYNLHFGACVDVLSLGFKFALLLFPSNVPTKTWFLGQVWFTNFIKFLYLAWLSCEHLLCLFGVKVLHLLR